MKNVVICIVLCVSFSVGFALQCYRCQGPASSCLQTCVNREDSCLKLTDTGGTMLQQQCIQYVNCDFSKLSLQFEVSDFKFHCCNTDLCNSGTVTALSKSLLSLITGLTVFWMCLM